MVSIPTKVITNDLTAGEFNQLPDELEQIVTDSGQTPAAGTLDQVSKAVATMVANADYSTDGGVADAYVLSVIAPNKAPHSYRNGMRIRFRTTNVNTGASTVNVATLGIKNIKKQDGSSDLDAGDISPTRENRAVYDGTSFRLTSNFVDASTTVKGVVELATNAELVTATDTTRPITPSNMKSLYTNSTLTSGISSWPVTSTVDSAFTEVRTIDKIETPGTPIAAGASLAITFGVAFPNAVRTVQITLISLGVNDQSNSPLITAQSTTGFTIKNADVDSTIISFNYKATGY